MRGILKGETKSIPYGKINQNALLIEPYGIINKINRYLSINLAEINSSGLLIIKRKNIGEVVEVMDDIVRIKFNTSFAFNNKLYVLNKPSIDKSLTLIYNGNN